MIKEIKSNKNIKKTEFLQDLLNKFSEFNEKIQMKEKTMNKIQKQPEIPDFKLEIERRHRNSGGNRFYQFPRKIDDEDQSSSNNSSIIFLNQVTVYHLVQQNAKRFKPVKKKEINQILQNYQSNASCSTKQETGIMNSQSQTQNISNSILENDVESKKSVNNYINLQNLIKQNENYKKQEKQKFDQSQETLKNQFKEQKFERLQTIEFLDDIDDQQIVNLDMFKKAPVKQTKLRKDFNNKINLKTETEFYDNFDRSLDKTRIIELIKSQVHREINQNCIIQNNQPKKLIPTIYQQITTPTNNVTKNFKNESRKKDSLFDQILYTQSKQIQKPKILNMTTTEKQQRDIKSQISHRNHTEQIKDSTNHFKKMTGNQSYSPREEDIKQKKQNLQKNIYQKIQKKVVKTDQDNIVKQNQKDSLLSNFIKVMQNKKGLPNSSAMRISSQPAMNDDFLIQKEDELIENKNSKQTQLMDFLLKNKFSFESKSKKNLHIEKD